MKLYLVRHGLAEHNVAAKLFGESAYEMPKYTDSNLTEIGVVQAKTASEKLKDVIFTDIYCSSLTRCIQTCDNLIKTDLVVKLSDLLMEPQGYHICNKRSEKHQLKSKLENFSNKYDFNGVVENYIFHKETEEELNNVISTFRDVLKKYNQNDNILIVSHHDWLQRFLKNIFNIEYSFQNCEVKIVELN